MVVCCLCRNALFLSPLRLRGPATRRLQQKRQQLLQQQAEQQTPYPKPGAAAAAAAAAAAEEDSINPSFFDDSDDLYPSQQQHKQHQQHQYDKQQLLQQQLLLLQQRGPPKRVGTGSYLDPMRAPQAVEGFNSAYKEFINTHQQQTRQQIVNRLIQHRRQQQQQQQKQQQQQQQQQQRQRGSASNGICPESAADASPPNRTAAAAAAAAAAGTAAAAGGGTAPAAAAAGTAAAGGGTAAAGGGSSLPFALAEVYVHHEQQLRSVAPRPHAFREACVQEFAAAAAAAANPLYPSTIPLDHLPAAAAAAPLQQKLQHIGKLINVPALPYIEAETQETLAALDSAAAEEEAAAATDAAADTAAEGATEAATEAPIEAPTDAAPIGGTQDAGGPQGTGGPLYSEGLGYDSFYGAPRRPWEVAAAAAAAAAPSIRISRPREGLDNGWGDDPDPDPRDDPDPGDDPRDDPRRRRSVGRRGRRGAAGAAAGRESAAEEAYLAPFIDEELKGEEEYKEAWRISCGYGLLLLLLGRRHSVLESYWSCRLRSCLFDVSYKRVLLIKGKDNISFLDLILSCYLHGQVKYGEACASLILDTKGLIIDKCFVLKGKTLMEVWKSGLDVSLCHSPKTCILSLQGPQAMQRFVQQIEAQIRKQSNAHPLSPIVRFFVYSSSSDSSSSSTDSSSDSSSSSSSSSKKYSISCVRGGSTGEDGIEFAAEEEPANLLIQ
ncbi:glycine cleavage T-protein domain containing protein, putative [Eimeria maxima]|uniref:Glycine cleavage T-protein domain containing protein, putative n=1 Tax=Eimeria maxima TaxID=5804 RepID=U6MAB7_EIMMA|nr:glycine cleavage T-protein domain containing protein, putative [Eimeria maxima]CDJ59993.1 glycine cleavage T-protein domain containing protein, putative [Eimeria maxima]